MSAPESRIDAARRAVTDVRERWSAWCAPTPVGLPATHLLIGGLAILAVVFLALVATSINGTSSGAFFPMVSSGSDPALLFGHPNTIRTDEWNVQTVWAIAQVEQGLPAINGTFPGGMDTSLPQDLPRVDWSVVFRPHLWGFLVFDVGHAQAWKWWLPVFGVAAAAYAFVLTVLPRRPLTALSVAVAFAASPFFAWWLLQTTLWPVAWGLLVLTAAFWVTRSRTRRSLWTFGILIGYLTVVVAMGIYVPFIIPVALVVAAVVVGVAIEAAPRIGWASVLRRLGVVLGAGVAAAGVLVVWLLTRWGTVSAFLSTAYPGERLEQTGHGANPEAVAALFGSSFTNALRRAGRFIDPNASESATFFLPGLFLGVVVLWLVVRERRRGRSTPWALLLGYVALLVLLAFAFIPGWDAVAHLLLLDRTTLGRIRIGLGFGSLVVLVLLMARVTPAARPGWVVSAIGPAVFLLSQVGIAVAVGLRAPDLLAAAGVWWAYAAVGAIVILAVARGWRTIAAAGMLVLSVVASYNINPLYLGVFDLRTTAPAQAIEELDDAHAGTWVGVGGKVVTALLLESGATAFNGFQGAPGREMWDAIDPSGSYEYQWNRLAGVSWVPGDGEPVVSNPYPDQIEVTFDACSTFAQEHVTYVLSDAASDESSACLTAVRSFDLPDGALTISKVVPRP